MRELRQASEKLQGRYPEGKRQVVEMGLILPSSVTILPWGKISLLAGGTGEACRKATVYSELEGERARHISLQEKKMNMLRASAGFREGALLWGRVHSKTSSRPATLAQPSLLLPLRFSLDGNFFFLRFY